MFNKNVPGNGYNSNLSGSLQRAAVLFFIFAFLIIPQSAAAKDNDESKVKRGFLHGLHVGATFPLGSLNDIQDSNVHFRMDAGYAFNNTLSLMAFLDFNQFTEDAEPMDLNYYWFNASLNLQMAVITTPQGVTYFLQGGPGLYIPKSNSNIPLSTTLGFNLGIGCRVPLRFPFHIEWAFYYHYTNISKPNDPTYSFLACHLGVIYIW